MKGKRVAILESRLGQELAELVTKRGGVPVHAPALAELPDLDPQAIAALIESLAGTPAKLFVFQTGVGTRALFAATDQLQLSGKLKDMLARSTVAVRGPKPTGALRAQHVRIDRSAADPFTTHEVLESIADLDVKNARVVIQRYGTVNVELDRALEARGAQVTEIPTYRWSLPKDTAPLGTKKDDGWAPTGDGIIDWKALWPLFLKTKADHIAVEHDNPSDWRVFAQRSYDYLKSLGA